jgi:hypothetical protein
VLGTVVVPAYSEKIIPTLQIRKRGIIASNQHVKFHVGTWHAIPLAFQAT